MKSKTISAAMIRMINDGEIRRIGNTINAYYEIIGKEGMGKDMGNDVGNSRPKTSETHTITEQAEAKQSYRNAATYIEYPLEGYDREGLKRLCDDKGIDFKQWAMHNNYPLIIFMEGQGGSYEIRVYNKCINIVPPDLSIPQTDSVPYAVVQEVLGRAWKVAQQVKDALDLKFKPINGIYVGALVRNELSQTHNPMAKDILEKKKNGELAVTEKTFRIYDPDTGRKCFEFDESPGEWFKSLKEAEATDPANADHHQTNVHRMLDGVLHHNEWEKMKDAQVQFRSGQEHQQTELKDIKESLLAFRSSMEATANAMQATAKAVETEAQERLKDREDIHLMAQNQGSHAGMVANLNQLYGSLSPLVNELKAKFELDQRQIQDLQGRLAKLEGRQGIFSKLKGLFKRG